MIRLRGRFHSARPNQAAAADTRGTGPGTTAASRLRTRCPFLWCLTRNLGNGLLRTAGQPLKGCFQGGVVVSTQGLPAGGRRRGQGPDDDRKSDGISAQRQRTGFSQSPLNEVPDNSVPDTLGNDEADAAR